MGISELKKVIHTVGKSVTLESLRGKRIGVDVSCFLYRFLRSEICRKICPDTPLLYGFSKQLKLFRDLQITPVYVFDGKPPQEKIVIADRRATDAKRKADLEELTNRISQIRQYSTITEVVESIDIDDTDDNNTRITDTIITTEEENIDELVFTLNLQKHKMELQSHRPDKENIGSVKELFSVFGVPMIQASAEADALLAQLSRDNVIDAVISTDTDQIALGSKVVLFPEKDISQLTRFDIQECYDLLGFTHEQFVDFCIMCGCDYVKRIKNIGIKTALSFIRAHHCIENVIANLEPDKFEIPEDYLENINTARTMLISNPDGALPSGFDIASIKWDFDKNRAKTFITEKYPSLLNQMQRDFFGAKGTQDGIKKFLIKHD